MRQSKQNFIFLFTLVCWCSLGSGALSLTRRARQTSCQGKFQCGDGTCLDMLDVCNGLIQCRDKSDESPAACDCGVIKPEESISVRSSGNTKGVSDAQQTSHPWHVAIYRINNKYHRLLCTGSLIYDDIVLTAASCVYDLDSSLPYQASSIYVSAGKVLREFSVDETSQQKFTVSKIVILDRYEGDAKGFVRNLAIIKLNGRIKRTDDVRPICLWEERRLPENKLALITGWGLLLLSNHAMSLRETSVGLLDCSKVHIDAIYNIFLTNDKFCLKFDKGVGLKDIDTGGAVDIYSGGRHYLIGVLSLNRTGNAYGMATEVRKYIPWIRNMTYQLKENERCAQGHHSFCGSQCIRAEQQCDGIKNCDDGSDEENCRATTTISSNWPLRHDDSCRIPESFDKFTRTNCSGRNCPVAGRELDSRTAPHGSMFSVTCLDNRRFRDPNRTYALMVCQYGEWIPPIDTYKCVETCPVIEYKSLDLRCQYKGDNVPCNGILRAGTRMDVQCKRHYKVNPNINFAKETVCRRDGSWQYVISECEPECGKLVTIDAETMISNGTEVKYPKYPWHTALYWVMQLSNGSVQYVYKCGGTLIHRNKVLTAAHCVWDASNRTIMEAEKLRVAISKLHSQWDDAKDVLAEKIGVVEVITGDYYNGEGTKYEHDIAVLILSRDLKFSNYLMPVCLDLDQSAGGVPVGHRLNVVGWGSLSASGSPQSDTLMEAKMEYLDLDKCRRSFKLSRFDTYLHTDKFCVLYINGSGSQQGDSGGGLTYEHNGHHYVYGVVSIKKRDQNEFALVTNVTTLRHWLLDILANK